MRTIFDVNKGCNIDETGLIVDVPRAGVGARSSTGYNIGKKYFEVECTLKAIGFNVGLCDANNNLQSNTLPSSASMLISLLEGTYRIGYGSRQDRGIPYPQGLYSNPAIIGVAIDLDEHMVSYYYNGVRLIHESYNGKVTNIGTNLYPFTMSGGGRGSTSMQTWNFGLKPFKYPIPTGYESWGQFNHHLYLEDNAVYGIQPTIQ